MRIDISDEGIRMRIREVQKHADLDPNPQNWVRYYN